MPPRFDGVIFDMDGTLIQGLLDFAGIRAELGVPADRKILDAIDEMPSDRRSEALAKLHALELGAAERAGLMPGADDVVEAVRRNGLKAALLTNNCQAAMNVVLERFGQLRFDLTWSRSRCRIKPEPDGVLAACAALGVAPPRAACVGDFHYDILAANAAGAVSILVKPPPRPEWAGEADHAITDIRELPGLLGI